MYPRLLLVSTSPSPPVARPDPTGRKSLRIVAARQGSASPPPCLRCFAEGIYFLPIPSYARVPVFHVSHFHLFHTHRQETNLEETVALFHFPISPLCHALEVFPSVLGHVRCPKFSPRSSKASDRENQGRSFFRDLQDRTCRAGVSLVAQTSRWILGPKGPFAPPSPMHCVPLSLEIGP